MLRPVLAALTLASVAVAQILAPLPGLPVVMPVPHPALAAQPLLDGGAATQRPAGGGSTGGTTTPRATGPTADPATTGPQLAGKDLKKAIAKVASLKWHGNLGEARVQSAATGKPILWLQALGDLEGFA